MADATPIINSIAVAVAVVVSVISCVAEAAVIIMVDASRYHSCCNDAAFAVVIVL
jgi:hypothetical protein